jgi:hypothetical protein
MIGNFMRRFDSILSSVESNAPGADKPSSTIEGEIPDSMVLALARELQFREFQTIKDNQSRIVRDIARTEAKLDRVLQYISSLSP